MPEPSLHATAIVIGEAGLLIRGRSGAGKSGLARALLAAAGQQGRFARLIGDDRVMIEEAAGRLVARGHPAISGLIEARGVGILPAEAEPACVVRLVIDLINHPPPRLPEEGGRIWPIPLPPQAKRSGGEGKGGGYEASVPAETPPTPDPSPPLRGGRGTRSPRLPEGETAVIAGVRLPLLTLGPSPDRADLALTRLWLLW